MNSQSTNLKSLLVWGMIPLTLLSGTPLFACVCANGDVKLLCQRRTGVVVEKSVPGNSSSDNESRTIKTIPACCRAHRIAQKSGNDLAVSARCCKAVLELPSPRVPVEKVSAPEQVPASLSLFVAHELLRASCPRHAERNNTRGDLPPPDLVIEHHAFLI